MQPPIVQLLHHRSAIVIGLACCATCMAPPLEEAPAEDDVSRASRIERLVQQLGDPVYERRTEATKALLAVGPAATPALQRAAQSDDYEVSWRARRLLGVLEQVLFAGVRIELDVSRTHVRWDEPVDLRMTFTSQATYPSRLPLVADEAARSRLPAGVRQVSQLLDVADFLVVEQDGKRIPLHVDDIRADPQVAAAVEARVSDGPESTLPAGGALTYVVQAFNRGWARYPMLHQGVYQVRLVYVPLWDDEELRAAEVGRADSNTVTVTVTDSSPSSVVGPGATPLLRVERQDDAVIARVVNASDVPLWINANLGRGQPPEAQFEWRWRASDREHRWTAGLDVAPVGGPRFDRRRLIKLNPGERYPLARTTWNAVRQAVGGGAEGGKATLSAAYTNQADIGWQRAHGSEAIADPATAAELHEPFPVPMFTGTLRSPPLELTGEE